MNRDAERQSIAPIKAWRCREPLLTTGWVRTRDPQGPIAGSASAEPAAAEPAPGQRIILLSGEARVGRSTYLMEGTLFAPANGALEGEILWTVGDSPWISKGISGAELVRGRACSSVLEFSGHTIQKPFIKERYRLVLYGAEEVGVFQGVSEAYGVWDAQLSGRYQIVNLNTPKI